MSFTTSDVVLVTGSTDGLGREVARRIAAAGALVIVHGRNRERGEALVREIVEDGRGAARFYAADFSSHAEVVAFADRIAADFPRIDVLVNNAGIWYNQQPTRQLSRDGHELHFAVNYLAGYTLTHRLMPLLRAARAARIINVASAAQQPIEFDNVMLGSRYSAGRAYAQSKLAQVMFTIDLAAQLEGTAMTAVSLHPATLMDTEMVREAGMPPRSTIREGADAVMQLVTGSGIRSGAFYDGLNPGRPHPQAGDVAARAQLRALSQRLTGLPAAR